MLALMTIRLNSGFLRALLLQTYGLLFVIPSIVAINAIISAYGASGYITFSLDYLLPGLSFDIYGFEGIIFAHMFFNMPLAARFFYIQLRQLPVNYFHIGTNLGFSSWHIFRHIDLPAILRVILPVSLIIFIYCFTSFAVILVFGGSPKYTNLELSIYQHLRYDFDLSSAASLSIIQSIILFIIVFILAPSKGVLHTSSLSYDNDLYRPERRLFSARLHDICGFILFATVCLIPLFCLFFRSLSLNIFLILFDWDFWSAFATSLQIASATLLLSFILLYIFLESWRFLYFRLHCYVLASGGIFITYLNWLFTPAILGTGLFLTLHSYGDSFSLPIWLNIVIINSFFSSLILLLLLYESYRQHCLNYNFLSTSLGIKGLRRGLMIDYILLRRPLMSGLGLIFIISLGDLTTVKLFSQGDTVTLPFYIHGLLSSYRFEFASSASLLLLLLNIMILFLFSYGNGLKYNA